MQRQSKRKTNLFCIIGKPGAGKQLILDNILSNARFIDKYDISRFVSGTTREIKSIDYDKSKYDRYSLEEYMNIDSDEIIESRSYDDIISGRIDYCFTLERHIEYGKNMIGITSLFQFEEIKKWAQIKQMENLSWEINIYPIYVEAPLLDRVKRLISISKGSDEYLYDMCAKIISERYEYRPLMENKVIDRSDPKVLCVSNADGINQMPRVCREVRSFIEKYCKDT